MATGAGGRDPSASSPREGGRPPRGRRPQGALPPAADGPRPPPANAPGPRRTRRARRPRRTLRASPANGPDPASANPPVPRPSPCAPGRRRPATPAVDAPRLRRSVAGQRRRPGPTRQRTPRRGAADQGPTPRRLSDSETRRGRPDAVGHRASGGLSTSQCVAHRLSSYAVPSSQADRCLHDASLWFSMVGTNRNGRPKPPPGARGNRLRGEFPAAAAASGRPRRPRDERTRPPRRVLRPPGTQRGTALQAAATPG